MDEDTTAVNAQQKVKSTQEKIELLKGASKSATLDVVKASQGYIRAIQGMSSATGALTSALINVAQLHPSDFGNAFQELAQYFQDIDDQYIKIASSIQNLVVPVQGNLKQTLSSVKDFEKEFKTKISKSASQSKQLEKAATKASKSKNPNDLTTAMREINQFEAQEDNERRSDLETVLLLDREKYAVLMEGCLGLVQSHIELGQLMQTEKTSSWNDLVTNRANLPSDQLDGLKTQESVTLRHLKPRQSMSMGGVVLYGTTSVLNHTDFEDESNYYSASSGSPRMSSPPPSGPPSGVPPPPMNMPPPSGMPPPPGMPPSGPSGVPPPPMNMPPPSGPPSGMPPPMGMPPSGPPPNRGPPSMAPPNRGPPSTAPPNRGPPNTAPPSRGPPAPSPRSQAPPPPPMFGAPPPAPKAQAPTFSAPPPSSAGRSGLLSAISGFKKTGLKKAQTNDRSGPIL
eukprot:TRINITY_DN459_c0_g1_i1.p1 TRINITY_DN459_c0_g1~~TRINITY_DN459_c0_g1_i1.p1  ORF type:complete len:464 (+),score=114.64 TRINITY_DN459_c0_g1_i1:29-1393(+)